MKKNITISLCLMMISFSGFAQGRSTLISVEGLKANDLYVALGGKDITGPGVIGLAKVKNIECNFDTGEEIESTDPLEKELTYHICAVDDGINEDWGMLFGENGARLANALVAAGVSYKGDLKNGSLAVKAVTCQKGVDAADFAADPKSLQAGALCIIEQ